MQPNASEPQATPKQARRAIDGALTRDRGRLLGLWMDAYDDADPPETTLNLYYLARLARPGAELRPGPEVTEARWFGPDELPDDPAFPRHAVDVLAAWRAATSGT